MQHTIKDRSGWSDGEARGREFMTSGDPIVSLSCALSFNRITEAFAKVSKSGDVIFKNHARYASDELAATRFARIKQKTEESANYCQSMITCNVQTKKNPT